MELITDSLSNELNELNEKNVRIRLMGSPEGLPTPLIECLERSVATTENNTGLTLQLAINYGGRQEVTHAVQALAEKVKAGELEPEAITANHISEELYHPDSQDLDLIIRPGGESRLSNFLLWQSAYAELAISPVMWPDFTPETFKQILADVHGRQRRFGR